MFGHGHSFVRHMATVACLAMLTPGIAQATPSYLIFNGMCNPRKAGSMSVESMALDRCAGAVDSLGAITDDPLIRFLR